MENINWTMLATIVSAVVAISAGIGFVLNKFYKLGTFASKFEAIENNVAKLNSEVADHQARITAITTTLLIKHKGLEAALTQRNSPRNLNAVGKQIFDMMHGEEFLKNNKDMLFGFIDKRHPKTALDVELNSMLACSMNSESDAFIPIKQFVYKCPAIKREGQEDFDVTLDAACYVLSFPLRDMYLKEHLELS